MNETRVRLEAREAARRRSAKLPTEASVRRIDALVSRAVERAEAAMFDIQRVVERYENEEPVEAVTSSTLGDLWIFGDGLSMEAENLRHLAERVNGLITDVDMIRLGQRLGEEATPDTAA